MFSLLMSVEEEQIVIPKHQILSFYLVSRYLEGSRIFVCIAIPGTAMAEEWFGNAKMRQTK